MVGVVIDQKAFRKSMREAPNSLFASMKKAMATHHRRFTNKVQVDRMSGRPGLKAPTGTMRRGLIVNLAGDRLSNLKVSSIFTGPHGPIAKFHEEGTNARHIPPRLEFKRTWDKMLPDFGKAIDEAVKVALKPRVGKTL